MSRHMGNERESTRQRGTQRMPGTIGTAFRRVCVEDRTVSKQRQVSRFPLCRSAQNAPGLCFDQHPIHDSTSHALCLRIVVKQLLSLNSCYTRFWLPVRHRCRVLVREKAGKTLILSNYSTFTNSNELQMRLQAGRLFLSPRRNLQPQ